MTPHGQVLTEVNFMLWDPHKAIENEIGVELDPHNGVNFLPVHVLETEEAVISKVDIVIPHIKLHDLALAELFGHFLVDHDAISADLHQNH